MNLDFPDTSKYKAKDQDNEDSEEKSSISLKDILRFENDLLSGRI